MRILALDTATRATAVALWDFDGDPVQARDDPPAGQRPRHATRLLALIAQALDSAEVGWDAIDRIAVGVGPGTFTGLRIGIATARALGRARGIPLVPVSTLQSLALNGTSAPRPTGIEALLAVLDARRRESFVAAWRLSEVDAFDSALLRPRVADAQALAELVSGITLPVLAVGDGAVEFRVVLERSGAFVPEDDSQLHRVSAINHCWLARGVAARVADEIEPEYLRLPDAEIARRAARSP